MFLLKLSSEFQNLIKQFENVRNMQTKFLRSETYRGHTFSGSQCVKKGFDVTFGYNLNSDVTNFDRILPIPFSNCIKN